MKQVDWTSIRAYDLYLQVPDLADRLGENREDLVEEIYSIIEIVQDWEQVNNRKLKLTNRIWGECGYKLSLGGLEVSHEYTEEDGSTVWGHRDKANHRYYDTERLLASLPSLLEQYNGGAAIAVTLRLANLADTCPPHLVDEWKVVITLLLSTDKDVSIVDFTCSQGRVDVGEHSVTKLTDGEWRVAVDEYHEQYFNYEELLVWIVSNL